MDVQHIARPAVRDGALGIGQTLLRVFQPGQQHQVMPPRQLSNSLLDNFGIRPRLGKSTHVHQVGAGKPLHFRKGGAQILRQPGYVTDGTDVLLDLYAADAEYSADALEDVYADLEVAGKKVLNPHLPDDEAALILSEIARGEDLNGRIRRNVLDTRRALSFLLRGKFLTADQQEDARQILRDIESLDGHTSFLFGKINFLMDATVGFININQNQRVSKLTTISVIFMPINILAGIGGMSEFSMMTQGIPWPVAYGIFTLGMMAVGWTTYLVLRHFEHRAAQKRVEKGGLST